MSATLPDEVEVVVVGAGLAGLAAGRLLQAAGRSVLVLESADGVGGRVRTDVVDGFQLDRGFQVLLTAYPELARQLDVAALHLREFAPGALVRIAGRFHRVGDPRRMPSSLPSAVLAPVGTVADKLRLAALQQRLRRTDPVDLLAQPDTSTIASLRDAGFGPTMIDRFFRPLLGGIQLDPELRGSSRMSDLILRCLTLGSSAVPASGMQAIPDQLASHLAPETVIVDTPVAAVGPRTVTTTDGRQVRARRVVVATDGPSAARLLRLPAVESLPASCVWFAAPRPPVRQRLIVLDGEGSGPALNVAIMSEVAPEYAPTGMALIAAACPGVADRDLEPAVRSQLRSMVGRTRHHLAPPSYRCHHPRTARAPPSVRTEAGDLRRRRPVRLWRPPRHAVDPGRTLLRPTHRGSRTAIPRLRRQVAVRAAAVRTPSPVP